MAAANAALVSLALVGHFETLLFVATAALQTVVALLTLLIHRAQPEEALCPSLQQKAAAMPAMPRASASRTSAF